MKGNKQWVASSTGPDWIDVATMMSAMGTLHQVEVAITITPGIFTGPYVRWAISAMHRPKEASVLGVPVMGLSGEWPCPEHADLIFCLFAGLYELDAKLGELLWKQLTLPGTEK